MPQQRTTDRQRGRSERLAARRSMVPPTPPPPPRDHSSEWDDYELSRRMVDLKTLQIHDLELPTSKLKVSAIRPNLYQLFEGGGIPDTLVPLVFEFINRIEGKNADQVEKAIEQHWDDYISVVNMVVTRIVVSPTFVLTTTEIMAAKAANKTGVYHIRTMPGPDRLWLFNWAQGMEGGALAALESFPDGPAFDVGDRGPVRDVPSGSVPGARTESDELGGVYVAEVGVAPVEMERPPTQRHVPEADPETGERRDPLPNRETVPVRGSDRTQGAQRPGRRAQRSPDARS